MIGFGQDIIGFSKRDIIVNQVLENTVSLIRERNIPKTEFRLYNYNEKYSLDWNKKALLKWQIIDKKENKTID
jgi:hypothetical protein